MRHLAILALLLLFPQTQVPVNIVIPNTNFTVGSGGSNVQTLVVTPDQLQNSVRPGYPTEGIYRLSFAVQNYFPNYPGYFTAKVSFGTQELCEASGWGKRNTADIAVICPSPGYLIVDERCDETTGNCLPPPQGNQPLTLTFSVPGWQIMFDNVALSFTPDQ